MASTRKRGSFMRVRGFFIFIFCTLLAVFTLLKQTPIFDYNEGEHYFYLYSKSSNASVVNVSNVDGAKRALNPFIVRGESVYLTTCEGANDYAQSIVIDKQAVLVFCEKLQGITCEYYYSPKIFNYVIINGKRVNLHLVKTSNGVKMGSPLVFDSF